MSEIWKPVPGWETLYSVSNLGNVRSEPRTVRFHGNTGRGTVEWITKQRQGRLLKPNTDSGGYQQVKLQRLNGGAREKVTVVIHRLVLLAFRGEHPTKKHGMHKNDDRADNRLANLKWGTRKENSQDMAQKGRRRGGGLGPYLTKAQRRSIAAQPKAPLKALAKEFKTSKSNISKIRAAALKGKL